MTPAVARTRACSSMTYPAAGHSTGFRDVVDVTLRLLLQRGSWSMIPCDQTSHLADNRGMVSRPVELKCAGTGVSGHAGALLR